MAGLGAVMDQGTVIASAISAVTDAAIPIATAMERGRGAEAADMAAVETTAAEAADMASATMEAATAEATAAVKMSAATVSAAAMANLRDEVVARSLRRR